MWCKTQRKSCKLNLGEEMSTGKRAYRLLKAYLSRESDRVDDVLESSAAKELKDFLKPGGTAQQKPKATTASSAPHPVEKKDSSEMDETTAYRVLNLPPHCTLSELKAAYKRLSERSLPSHFPEDSEERKIAAKLHLRVQQAYDILLPKHDKRLKRFRSLEVD